MKQNKFIKKVFTWNRNRDGVIQVVDFQQSHFDSDSVKNFTINLGIWDAEIWTLCWGKDAPAFINIHECFPTLRIGELISSSPETAIDKWWAIDKNTDLRDLGQEIVKLLIDHCFPHLESMLDRSKIVELSVKRAGKLTLIEKVYLAIVHSRLGDEKTSQKLLAEVEASSGEWEGRVNAVRSRL